MPFLSITCNIALFCRFLRYTFPIVSLVSCFSWHQYSFFATYSILFSSQSYFSAHNQVHGSNLTMNAFYIYFEILKQSSAIIYQLIMCPCAIASMMSVVTFCINFAASMKLKFPFMSIIFKELHSTNHFFSFNI